jgi:hypothetical protein
LRAFSLFPQDTAGVQDTFAVQRWIPVRLRAYSLFPQDTAGVQGVFPGGYYLFGTPQDTAGAGVDRTRYTGGYFLYALPQDTTKPAELVDYYVPNGIPQGTTEPASAARSGGPRIVNQWTKALAGGDRRYAPPQDTTKPAQLVDYGTPQGTTEPASAARINIKPLADRVVVEPAPAEDRRGPILVMGQFIPTHVGLPMPELELDPGDGPVCGIPGSLGQGEETVGSTAREKAKDGKGGGRRYYHGYVLNWAIAPGDRPLSGKTLGAVTWRQAPPQGGNQNMGQAIRQQLAELGAEVEVHRMAGPISLPRPSDVGIPEFRMVEGGMPVLWPNGNPPRDPDWPWVGVIGTPVLEGIDGAPGPGKPQNWCGTEYIWTGPRPKSPKELILTPVFPRP